MVISEKKIKRNIRSISSEVLNGENYNRSDFARSLLNYPAMMVPSVQEPIIEELSDVLNNEVSLLDPFMGASNTLVTGMKYGMNVFGQDINPLSLLLSKLKEIQNTLEKVEKVISRTEKLNEVINILEPKIQILEEQLMNFSELASLGLTAESVSHEFSSIADRLAERASFYGAKLHGKNITDSDLYVFFEYINSTVNGLKIQLKHLDPTLKYNREKKSEIKLSLFFKEESEYYKNRLQKNSIDFTIFLEDDFSISINRGKIVQIIDNLISNSEYWLIKLKGNDPNCKPSITIKIESPWIYFYDNGYGISPAIENMLFEPFVTTKPKGEGRGLGLFIIQQLLDSSKCTIALEPFRNEHGRKYIFAINFSNIINEYK